jgi:hypothetical protein
LGILEAGFLPCCLFLISAWYRRYDLQKRVTVFYAIGLFASGFGGILAYGFMQMVSVAVPIESMDECFLTWFHGRTALAISVAGGGFTSWKGW